MSQEKILLARQPIYNTEREIAGYELLFRTEVMPEKLDGNAATSQVLINAFLENRIEEITGGALAFVNFTRELLLEAVSFPPTPNLVIEILEDIHPDPEVMQAIETLKGRGATLAMDDYIPGTDMDAFLPFVDIVKLELPAIPPERLPLVIKALKQRNITLLAEKIETAEEFDNCLNQGCSLFQGYFLSKPIIVKGRKLPQSKLAVLQLLATIQNPALSIKAVIDTITKDPGLSFKLLQVVNSAAYRRPQKIDSIHMAVMLLGISRIKAWVTLLAMSSLDDKPASLVKIALLRARLCEMMAEHLDPNSRDAYFTIGLFSCLEAFFDTPIQELLLQLPLDPKIQEAITRMKGKAGLALHTTIQYERCKLENIHWNLLQRFGLDPQQISDMNVQAVQWVDAQEGIA